MININNLMWVFLATLVAEYCRSWIMLHWWFAEILVCLYLQQAIKSTIRFGQFNKFLGKQSSAAIIKDASFCLTTYISFLYLGDRCAWTLCIIHHLHNRIVACYRSPSLSSPHQLFLSTSITGYMYVYMQWCTISRKLTNLAHYSAFSVWSTLFYSICFLK